MQKFKDAFVVGIDVSSESSVVAMIAPNGEVIGKPFKINHDPKGFSKLLEVLKKEEERLKSSPIYFVESTGIYHLPLFFFLKSQEIKGYVINPLSLNSIKKSSIRKAKNDRIDAGNIAYAAKYHEIKLSQLIVPEILALKFVIRDYYSLSQTIVQLKLRFASELSLVFPGYSRAFSDICCKTSLNILKKYPTPQMLNDCNREELIEDLLHFSRRGKEWATKKADILKSYTNFAGTMTFEMRQLSGSLMIQLNGIESLEVNLSRLREQIEMMVNAPEFPEKQRVNIELIKTIPAIGFLTAATIISEIGEIENFESIKALTAFFGIDPSVHESGKFKGDHNKISKRGTRFGRKALFAAAVGSVKINTNKIPVNVVLYQYYREKLKTKKKKVALVAVMHKILTYIFAVLRDQKQYAIRLPEEHQTWRIQTFQNTTAA